MADDNLRVLKGGGNSSLSKEALQKMRADLPMMVEYYLIYAEMARAKYDALLKQGFTEVQSLELSKSLF